jgi:hypothetical protein
LRRKVTGRELPRRLRRLGIAEVVIERAGQDRFIRTFFDHAGRPMAAGTDDFKNKVMPGAPEHTIVLTPGGPAVVDSADATRVDREYFEQNPNSVEYERDVLPVELDEARSSLGFRPWSGRVRVRQLVPCVRRKQQRKELQ